MMERIFRERDRMAMMNVMGMFVQFMSDGVSLRDLVVERYCFTGL